MDDNDNGFQRYYGPVWDRMAVGYEGDCWIAPSTADNSASRHYAIWVPELESGGEYDISVYIPSGLDATTAAVYEIYVKNEDGQSQKTTVVHDQSQNTNGFHTIATLDLPAGSNCGVILRDIVGGESSGSFVIFDAIRFTSAGTVSTVNGDVDHTFPEYLSINKVYPNPFNPKVTVEYQVAQKENISIWVVDLNGKKIKKIKEFQGSKGIHKAVWNGDNDYGENVSSGLYFLSIMAGNSIKTAKVLLLE